MNCNICNVECLTYRSLGAHIKKIHNMTSQQYYDLYYKKDSDGFCINCKKPTQFLGLSKGYRKFCSKICCNTSEYHIEKMKNTIIERYGGLGTASSIINEKIKSTNILKYGSENLYSSEYGKNKIKQSNLAKFNVEYACQSPIVKEKIVQTSLARYNTSNPGNCKSGRIKAAITRRANDNDSSWEDYFEKQLNILHINYKKRYNNDERYPYQCDFYLPDTDTFIEINGYWTHGGHWFDENSADDKAKLALWINKANKGHKQYKNAINIWTVRDTQKHNTAINNNLNYIVLWTFEDIINFFNDKKGI